MNSAADDSLAPYRPDHDGPWGKNEAAHLLRRTAFGATAAEVAAVTERGPEAVLDRLKAIDGTTDSASREARSISERAGRRRDIEALQAAWLHRLVTTPRMIAERVALFWHDHFATSDAKVQDALAMHAQNELFMTLGLGEFATLLRAVARDPAMIRWLDGDSNVKGIPNENFARELFELFTLGIGNYSETDIRESARAFTGRRVDQGAYRVDPAAHDGGEKRVFGKVVESGDDVIDLCVAREECRRFIAVKLCREFVTTEISSDLASALGNLMAECRWKIGEFLGRLLVSRLFYSSDVRGGLFRSPVAYVVGLVRTLDVRVNAADLAMRIAEMSQDLFRPPSVKGWDKGRAWITTASLAARRRFAAEVRRGAAGSLKLTPRSDAVVSTEHLTRMLTIDEVTTKSDRSMSVTNVFDHAALILETPAAQLF